LSSNEKAIELLKENIDKVHWGNLSGNTGAMEILKDNQDKINWMRFSGNKSIFIED